MSKILELFSGTGEVSLRFKDGGFDIFRVDWDEQFDAEMHCDIGTITSEQILEKFGRPDVIFCAFDCTSYSLAAISHHRQKNKETGNLDPISDYARKCDEVNQHILKVIEELNPKVFWFENPRAGLQKMTFMQPYEKYKHTVTYCKYMMDEPVEKRRMKPTNLWTNIPDPQLIPPCGYGDDCHPKTPRGSRTGTQGLKGAKERSRYPKALIEHIFYITNTYLKENNTNE